MTVSVRRAAHKLSKRQGSPALEQRFRFEGDPVDAAAIVNVLLTAPLVGVDSVFGTRPGSEGIESGNSRHVRGFSPAPGFLFDVDLAPVGDDAFLIGFSQPDRDVPYLDGHLLWTISDAAGGAVLDEQINTKRVVETGGRPLGGPKLSLRRWLFFRIGHKQVMTGATENIAAILNQPGT